MKSYRYGAPEEVLTDNGSQYVTWRGKSAFTKETGETWGAAGGGLAAAPADAGKDRALLGYAVARVHGGGGVPRPGRRPPAHRAVHRSLQLPAAPSGHRRAGAGGPLLRGGP